MTTRTEAVSGIPGPRSARGAAVGEADGVPVYPSGEGPAAALTRTQLRQRRLKVAPGQRPVAYVVTRWYGDRVPLYDPGAAVKMRPLPSSVKRRMLARRTCPVCGKVRQDIVRYGRCGVCLAREAEARRRREVRTCGRCRAERKRPYPRRGLLRLCPTCRRERAAAERARVERWLDEARFCREEGCTARVATRKELREWRRADARRRSHPGTFWIPRLCPPCQEEAERRRAEEERRRLHQLEEERAARRREVEDLEAWAREVLADERAVILDTETTGLDDDARIVEISVITVGGAVLLDTLVNPGEPIPRAATAIHGIGDDDVRDAPRFADVLARLTAALDGRRVVIYNASYDVGRLRHELSLYYGKQDAAAWLGARRFEDAMGPYSDWYGDWNDYFGNYTWQPLGGGHRALGDCRAVLARLREMAASDDRSGAWCN